MIRFDYQRNVMLARGRSINLDSFRDFLLSSYPLLCAQYKLPSHGSGVHKYAWDTIFNESRNVFIADLFLDLKCL
jgi:hypothetical protein